MQLPRLGRFGRHGVALALALAAGWAAPAWGQEFEPDPGSISGRDFAGMQLPLEAVEGPMGFSAQRAWAWTEDGGDGTVRRMLLSGDVRVRLGVYEFAASRAAVWIESLPGAAEGKTRRQVFVYFDRVSTPTADAAISISADRLPVRAIMDWNEGPTLRADVLRPERPEDGFLGEGEFALARALRSTYEAGRAFNEQQDRENDPTQRLRDELAAIRRQQDALPNQRIEPGLSRPYEPESGRTAARGSTEDVLRRLSGDVPAAPIFARAGIVTIAPGQITLVRGESENAIVASEGVSIQYTDQRSDRTLLITAQRAVVFLAPGELTQMGSFGVRDVKGIYLEGGVVASDGRYTLRGPRMYYDVQANRAVVLDAVFWAYDARRRMPLYLRAAAIRQESDSEFRASKAVLANSAFFEPQLSVGVSALTIKRREVARGGGGGGGGGGGAGGSGESTAEVDARSIALKAGPVPFFWFPRYKGDPTTIPLRDLRVENSSESGVTVKTTWDIFGLAGLDPVEGLSAELLADAYFQRGPGLGTQLSWEPWGPLEDSRGSLLAYTVIDDRGEDLLKPGTERDWDGATRGIILADNAWKLGESWRLFTEGAYISDETFIDQFFEPLGETRREFTTRGNLRRTDENTLFMLDAQTNLNDFIANEYLSQSRGYNVDRLPELSYFRVGDDLFSGTPGLLSYSSDYRFGRLSMNFDEVEARERGFDTEALSRDGFGISPTQSIADRLRSQGMFEDGVYRFDTRHEFSSQLSAGPVNITPFVVGRGTMWDNDFSAYSPNEEDNVRGWGQAGTRFATQIQRVDDTVDSRLFDLNRMRHIIEPNATIAVAGTNVDRTSLPVYDENVEGIAEGTIGRIAIDQTWQTQRGGPGRWHSVDVFRLNTGFTQSSDDADREYDIARWIGHRPEYSSVGEAFDAEGSWQLSDAYLIAGSMVYDTDDSRFARSNAGLQVAHNPEYSSFVEYRQLDLQDSQVLDLGARYLMTSKYEIGGWVTYDLSAGEWQGVNADVRRRFASVLLGVNISWDTIDDEFGFGFVFQPTGVRGQTTVRGVGSSQRTQRGFGSGG